MYRHRNLALALLASATSRARLAPAILVAVRLSAAGLSAATLVSALTRLLAVLIGLARLATLLSTLGTGHESVQQFLLSSPPVHELNLRH